MIAAGSSRRTRSASARACPKLCAAGTTARRSPSRRRRRVLHDPARLDVADLAERHVGPLEPPHRRRPPRWSRPRGARACPRPRTSGSARTASRQRSYTGGGTIRLIVPVLVLEQHEGDPLRGGRALAGDDHPRHAHALAVRAPLEVGARDARPSASVGPHQLDRVLAQRHLGRAVVGEQPLPRRQLVAAPAPRPLDRQRELRAARHASRPAPRPRAARAPRAGRPATSASHAPAHASRSSESRSASRSAPRDSATEPNTPPARAPPRSPRTSSSDATPVDVAEPDPHRAAAAARSTRQLGAPSAATSRRQHRDPAPLRLVHERVRRVEAHRLLVQQRAQELRAVVHAQPGGLVGEQPERRRVRLREAEAREADDLRRRRARRPRATAPRATAPVDELLLEARIAASERLRLIARRSPSASPGVKPANAIATSITWSWKTIAPSVSRSTGSSDGCSYGTW